jgi:hypothetical protein
MNKPKAGRKRLNPKQLKKPITIYLTQETIERIGRAQILKTLNNYATATFLHQ